MAYRALTAADWHLWHTWMEAQRIISIQIDDALRSEAGVSKSEFSILRTVGGAPGATIRVVELATALRWEKSRVAHLLTRMEQRDLMTRIEDGAPGRRTAVTLTVRGRTALREALRVHEENVARILTEQLTGSQAAAIRDWSEHVVCTPPGSPLADRSAETQHRASSPAAS